MNSKASKLAARIARLEPSPIREILSVLERPGMISFAGGLPSAESFPPTSLDRVPPAAMQYGASEGDSDLRELVARELGQRGLHCDAEQVLILSGSQQGIDLVAKLMIETGTRVAVESPTYLAALQVFRLFGAEFVTFNSQSLRKLSVERPALLYVNPSFQNPTGYCYNLDERQAVAASCARDGTILFEDDPYRDLVYEPCDRTPICALAGDAGWVYQSSFSKTFAPGLRLGYLACSKDLVPYLTRLKQAADLHSSRLSQRLVVAHLTSTNRATHLRNLVEIYDHKRRRFDHYLQRYFGDIARWEVPQGGLFFWLHLKGHEPIDTRKLLPRAIDNDVAYMPGEPFFASDPGVGNAFRLNFSLASEAQMDTGLARLADIFRVALSDTPQSAGQSVAAL